MINFIEEVSLSTFYGCAKRRTHFCSSNNKAKKLTVSYFCNSGLNCVHPFFVLLKTRFDIFFHARIFFSCFYTILFHILGWVCSVYRYIITFASSFLKHILSGFLKKSEMNEVFEMF